MPTSEQIPETQMVLLTEKCTGRTCGGRVRYGELTDPANTHWHIRKGVALVPSASLLSGLAVQYQSPNGTSLTRCCCDQTTARLVVCPLHPDGLVTPPREQAQP